MKTSELRKKSVKELKEELLTLRKEQFNMRFQVAAGQLEKTSRVKEVRRSIARIKTLITESNG